MLNYYYRIIIFSFLTMSSSWLPTIQVRGTSMCDLVDASLVELGMSLDTPSGVENPLAMMTKVIDGEEMIISPGDSDVDSDETCTTLVSFLTNK